MKTTILAAAAAAGFLVSGVCQGQTPVVDADTVGQEIHLDIPHTIEHHVYEPDPVTVRLHPQVTSTTTHHRRPAAVRQLPPPMQAAPVVQYLPQVHQHFQTYHVPVRQQFVQHVAPQTVQTVQTVAAVPCSDCQPVQQQFVPQRVAAPPTCTWHCIPDQQQQAAVEEPRRGLLARCRERRQGGSLGLSL